MKTNLKKLWPLLVASAVISCDLFTDQSTPEGYVRYCVQLLSKEGLYADSEEWAARKKAVLDSAKTITSFEEAHSMVHHAAKVAGGKHSFLMAPVTDTSTYVEVAPKVNLLEGNIAYVKLPAHSAVTVSDSLYIHTVYDFLEEHLDAKGVIVDLRGNTGGNMYPMIASVSPLLPDGVILKFKSLKRTSFITLDYVVNTFQMAPESIGKFPTSTPVAILTDYATGSSGEATLLCFRGLDNVKTFGGPSAGYASGNMSHILSDGYLLAVTQFCDVARTGEVFSEDPIEPDINTENPLEDAAEWIQSFTPAF